MPQILAGFDILGAFIWRGINIVGKRQLIWRAPDGTEMPSFRFGPVGYCDYAFRIRRAQLPDWKMEDPESLAEEFDRYTEDEIRATDTESLLFFDGGDHQEWDQGIYDVFSKWSAWEGQEYDVQHTSLDQFLLDMVEQKDRITASVEGELRDPGFYPVDQDQQWIIPGVLSSRVWMKQANNRCQSLLCSWAEPFSAFSHHLLGTEVPQGYLTVAWRWLLQNHPHDSIDGCSIDQVHRDMRYRFDQSQIISNRQAEESLRQIALCVQDDIKQDELRITVFNPQPRPFTGITELNLQLPPEWPTFNEFFGYEPKPAFRIYDPHGQEIPYQRLAQTGKHAQKRHYKAKFSQAYTSNDVVVSLPLSVPALGFTSLTVRHGTAGLPTRHPSIPGLAVNERSLENEFLRLEIEPNGSITLTDKRTGFTYSRLLTFEDIADIGDGWYHGQAVNDQVFVSTACRAEVALVQDGPLQSSFRICLSMPIPDEFLFERMNRSEKRAEMIIDSLLCLRKGQDFLEVTSTVHNPAGDHRLRVLFPSGAQTDSYLADAAFDVVERPIALRSDNYLYRELEVETRPQQSWSAVFGGGRGLAVVAEGLLESTVRDLPERPLALTLFRATRRTVMTDGEPEGQLYGASTFRYWIMPLQDQPDRTRLGELGQRISAGLRSVQLLPIDQTQNTLPQSLPKTGGFFELAGEALLSSARETAEGFEVRLYNPHAKTIPVSLNFPVYPGTNLPWRHFRMVNLESQPLSDLQSFQNNVNLEMSAKKIITIQLMK